MTTNKQIANYDWNDDAEKAFARLEELLTLLDDMQAKDAQLALARQARELRELASRAKSLDNEIKGYEEIRNKALADSSAANAAGDKQAQDKAVALLRMYSDLWSLRMAPAQRAASVLSQALQQGSLTLDDDLNEIALDEASYTALEAEINAYREEYLACYERCKMLESAHHL